MAITVIATTKVSGATGGTTPPFDSTGANCIAVWLAYGGSPTVTDNQGNTYTATTQRTNTVSGRWYYCLSATVGTGHTVTIGGGSVVASCVVYALAGVAASGAYVAPAGSIDISSATQAVTPSVSTTPPEDNCIVLMGGGTNTSTISGVAGANSWTLDQWTTGVGGTNYGSLAAYKIQTTATAVPTSEVWATWTGSANGVTVPAVFKSAGAAAGLTISTPVELKVHQRSGTTGSIAITGTVSGATEDIEARFNGGAWTTIATAVAAGSFSGTLTGQAQGRGTLEVRKKTTTAAADSVNNIGIGDVFVIGGDSISEGRGTNAQSYTGSPAPSAFRQDDAWVAANDPVDTGTSIGSHWPLLASLIAADQGVPVAFISTGSGGTDVAGSNNTWAKPGAAYTEMTTQVSQSAVNGVKAVLMHLGPNAVVNASTLSLATYNAALDTLAANIAADVVGAPKLHLGIFGEVSTGSPPDRVTALNNLRGAIQQALADNANIRPGPCLIDLDYSDGVHPKSDAELQAVARRWFVALKATYYGGSGGRGPRISSATWNAGRDQLSVVFDRALKAGLTHATQPWAVSDNGSAMTVSSVAYHGSNANTLLVNTSAAATGPDGTTTLTFAGGDTAVGRVIPMSADITLPGAFGTTQIPAEPTYALTVIEDGAVVPATTVTLTLTTNGTTPAAGLTGLRWAFFDQATPDLLSAPVAQGASESTDGSGVLTLTITGTALAVGETGYLVVSNTDGSASTDQSAFAGPVVVS